MTTNARQKPSAKSIFTIILKIYLGIFLVLILVWVINLGWHVFDLYSVARSALADPGSVQTSSLVPLVGKASGDIDTIYRQLKPLSPVFNALHGLPWLGQYLGQVDPVITYMDGISQAGNEVVLGLAPLLETSQSDQPGLSLPERASQVLKDGQAHFVAAADAIQNARQVRDRIDPQDIPAQLRPLFEKVDSRFNLLEAGVQLLQSAPRLLGDGQSETYLILAQNRDELRATGGFISGIGLITLQNGQITQLSLGDSYAVDDFTKPYPTPPEPLKRFMLSDYWVPRDANWSPDYPATARQAQSLYQLSTGIATQGVFAFNQLAVQAVLRVIGPVQVAGTAELVTADNVENFMRQAWAPAPEQGLSQEWWQHRKDFMLQLGSVIIDKALGMRDPQQLLSLATAITSLLDQGQLLVYFNDASSQQALQVAGWDGGIHTGDSDYLYLVDSNVGFNKVDSVINRSVTYQVDLTDITSPMASVTLNYQNTGSGNVPCQQVASYGNGTYQDMQQRCYWDYWRLYSPSGSTLTAATAQPVAADALLNGQGWSGQVETLSVEAGAQVFAGMVVLPQSQSSYTQLSYNLPLKVIQPRDLRYLEYSLNVQVQSGLAGIPFLIQVSLPDDAVLSRPGEGWKLDALGAWSWQGVITRQTHFILSFEIKP